MNKLRTIFDTLNYLTGISRRHNRALRDIKDWAMTVQRFLTLYDLYGSSNFDTLFKNIGEAKFDLTAIVHKARPLIRTAKNIKSPLVSPLLTELVTGVESLRRTLIINSLSDKELSEVMQNLLVPFEQLQDTLSAIDNI